MFGRSVDILFMASDVKEHQIAEISSETSSTWSWLLFLLLTQSMDFASQWLILNFARFVKIGSSNEVL